MSKKADKQLLLRTVVAGVLIVVSLILMAVGLKQCPSSDPEPKPQPYNPVEPVPGIDVSAHQGQIDWQAVAESRVKFVMVRLGYRGYDSGTLHVDPYARQNLEGARAAGLKVGAYFFSQALNEQEALEEATLALQVLEGFPLDMPLAYDWEYVTAEARTGAMEPDTLLSCVHAFCGAVAEDYEPMVYFNQELSRTLLDLEQVAQYPFWYARYAPRPEADFPIRMWQHTDSGTVPGIAGAVDLDWYYPH